VDNGYTALAYSAKFGGSSNDYGIPVCTDDIEDNYYAGDCSSTNVRTDSHRVKIHFLGGEWVISEMTAPEEDTDGNRDVINGGSIKLAKEASHNIISIGQSLDAGTFKVRLADISFAVGGENEHPAIMDILNANGDVVKQIQVTPTQTYNYVQASTGDTIKIHVYQTAPGLTLAAKWAEVAIYTDELTLEDDKELGYGTANNPNEDFMVSLYWKNKDYVADGDVGEYADHLREIVIYSLGADNDDVGDMQVPGTTIDFPKEDAAYKLTYEGLNLDPTADYASLDFKALNKKDYKVAIDEGVAGDCAATIDYSDAAMIEISLSDGSFGSTETNLLPDGETTSKVLFDPIGPDVGDEAIYADNEIDVDVAQGDASAMTLATDFQPIILWKSSDDECYLWQEIGTTLANAYYENDAETALDTYALAIESAGMDDNARGGLFFVSNAGDPVKATDANDYYFGELVLKEDAGETTGSSNTPVYTSFVFTVPGWDNADSTVRFVATDDSADPQGIYTDVDAADHTYDVPFYTERGSKMSSVASKSATLKVAKEIGEATFQLALSDTTNATTGEDKVLGVGEKVTINGVTVTVKKIDASAGTCNVAGPGGSLGCTVDMAPVSAVIMPANKASVDTIVPVPLTSSLVGMDTDGASSQVAILVGGPAVNTMTADALKDSTVDLNVDTVVVKELGNKIVVAGKSAADTMAAADEFIAGVKRQ
jgi:hypothetical protein